MMDAPGGAELFESGPFSTSLRDVLERSRVWVRQASGVVTKGGSAAEVTPEPRWSLLGVLYHAADGQTAPGGAARVFAAHRAALAAFGRDEIDRHSQQDAAGTDQLRAALLDALSIRERTGGQDGYIGLRHALFAILLPQEPTAFADTYRLLARGGVDPVHLARDIATFCLENGEASENAELWQDLIEKRLSRLQSLGLVVSSAVQVATPGADDPWAPDRVDRSGAQLEAEAFASMICWRDFTPPLAVGVFGDWGSGKSFFMRLVHDAIARRTAAPGGVEGAFLDHVVQVRFNAWHYAETNLWASLVDHILTELDAWALGATGTDTAQTVFSKLDTAREWTLEAARDLIDRRAAIETAEAALETATQALKDKETALASDMSVWRRGVWNRLFQSEIDPAIRTAVRDLGLGDDELKTGDDLRRALELYHPDSQGAALRDWMRCIGSNPRWGIGLAAALVVLPIGLVAGMNALDLPAAGGAVAGAVAPVAAFMAHVSRHLRDAHTRLAEARGKVAAEIERQTADETAKRAALEAELEAAQRAAEAAGARLQEMQDALKSAEADYKRDNAKARLLDFVRERVSSGDYRKQLSFIARVRRDFEELSRLMNDRTAPAESRGRRETHKAQVAGLLAEAGSRLTDEERALLEGSCADPEETEAPAVFERIVLYIDDLDRCGSDEVVMVLEAIHLLLAYPLFVVFVAVDVRWLEQSLREARKQFAHAPGEARDRATAGDYLEKIIQIPYWVRAMTPENTEALLSDLMAVPATDGPLPGGEAAPGADGAWGGAGAGAGAGAGDGAGDGAGAGAGAGAGDGTGDGAGIGDGAAQRPSATQLEFSEAESRYVRALSAGLDGSPRRTLRFVNSYRLIKASLTVAQRRRLDDDDHRAVLTLLAVQVCSSEIDAADPGQSDCFKALVAQLRADPAGVLDWARTLKDCPAQARMVHVLETYQQAGGSFEALRAQSAVVARFGFSMP